MSAIHRILLPGILIFFFSCKKDFLNKTPLDFISPDNYLTNDAQAEILLNGIYNSLDFIKNPNENQKMAPIHFDTMTDDVFDPQPWHNTTEWARGQGNSNSPWASWKWDLNYQGVARANVFLSSILRADFKSNYIKRYIGEAKFLRAWFYNDLVTFYGDIPLILLPGELNNSRPFRTPKKEVIDQILKDLDEAIPVLPLKYENSKDRGRITKGTAMGFKARVLLYDGQWEKAAAAAKAVMDLGIYSLFPDYQGLFLEKNEASIDQEVMLQVFYTPDIMPSFLYYPIGEYPAFSPTLQLVNAYHMKNGLPITNPLSGYDPQNPHMNRDPRLAASVFYPGCQYLNFMIKSPDPAVSKDSILIPTWLLNTSGFRARKHFDGTLTASTKEGRNKYFLRYAEVLLTYAEAQNEAFGPADAYGAVDQLRRRVGMTTLSQAMPGLSKEEMRKEIRNERRVELAFEGLRLPDIRRWRIGEEVMVNALGYDNTKLITYPGNGMGTTNLWKYEALVIDNRQFNPSRDYVWPIPRNEMNSNPNMVQNSGY